MSRLEPDGDPDFRSASGDDTVDYQVNAQGTEITRTTPSGKSTRMLLSHAGFPLRKWVQGLLAATWIWSADGHLDQSTTARTATDHHRDAFGHDAGADFSTPDSAAVPTPAIALTNDRLGRPLEITDGSGRREMDHEGLREISQTWTGDGHAPFGASLAGFELRRVFSPADGRLTGLQVLRGGAAVHAITFARDAHGRIQSVGDTHGGGGAYTAFLPGTSMPLALDRPGPGDTTWAYDQERRLDSLATGGFGFDLQYNSGGLISRVIPSTGTSTAFSYNARRELTGADGPQAFTYGYDGSRNRVSASLPVAALGGSGIVQVSLVYQPDALHGYQAVGSATSGTPESVHLVRVQGTVNRTAPVRLQVRADGDLVYDQLLPPQPENVFEVQIPLRNLAATARTVTLAVTGILPGGAANGRDAMARLDETVILPALDVLARGGIEDRAYDADGNLTSDGTWSYAWNGRNQLAAMERPGESLAFEYNAEGMRTFKRHRRTDAEGAVTERLHRFVWDGAMLLVEEITETLPDSAPQTWHRTYTWGLDLSGSVGGAGGTGGLLSIHDTRLGQTVLPVSNHRGDVVALLSTTGATVAEWDFGPFGEPLPATGDPAWLDACRIGFGSKYTDPETGLVYFGYRYYDPRHGRWLGREPLGEEESFNPYAYCHNDPVNRYDYLGLETISTYEDKIRRNLQAIRIYRESADTLSDKLFAEDRAATLEEQNVIYNSRIDAIRRTAEKWNNAVGEIVLHPEGLDDTDFSFLKLQSDDPMTMRNLCTISASYLAKVLSENADLLQAFHDSAASNAISPQALAATITLETRGIISPVNTVANWSNDGPTRAMPGAHLEALLKSWPKFLASSGRQGSFGPAQLSLDARDAAGLTIPQAMTWEGAFLGASVWLSSNDVGLRRLMELSRDKYSGAFDFERLASSRAAAYNGSYANGVYYDLVRKHIWTDESF